MDFRSDDVCHPNIRTGINLLCPINQVPDQMFLPPCEKTAMWNASVTGVLDEIGNAVNTTG
jgi:hypothetical protein